MLDKKYNHIDVENNKYNKWLENKYFESGDLSKKPFSIVIPPPNVTGRLHLGHAWDTTLQDIIIRYKRMDGFDALWLPGMDHAGIATQAKVDEKLRASGIQPRDMTRDEWLDHAWQWKEEYALNIRDQWGKLGLSLDYTKERFTLDEGLNNAVNEVFIKLYKKGLIYRGERIINWDPKAKTALSNIEVIHKEVAGAFYHFKYILEDGSSFLEVATTRPETIFGDTAVAVNPNDERYKDLVGKKVFVPIIGRLIPIIADNHADMEFGTGALKVTPAHDPNDFEIGNRHNLERILCMNEDGTMNSNAAGYEGLDRFVCREKLVADATAQDLLIKKVEHIHSVGHSERTDVIVEPYLSKQWFVKMDVLAENALANQTGENKVDFVPERFEKIFNNWMENIEDWCISRQLWWGHQIPAWYKDGEVYVGENAPGEDWTRDTDVLDTWFSSALWPFSTMGWPENTDMLNRYFPNNVLVTGYDIIFFWVSRMIFQSIEFTGKAPFKEVLIHGLVRDKDGKKMSKSLGNGVDPMDVIDEYGADALRFFLATGSAPGQDLRYDEDKVKSTWNFINKLWNASRFVMMNLEDFDDLTFDNLSISDKWILTKLNKTIKKVRKHMDKYEFNVVGAELYSFIWDDYCDWYIELSKLDMSDTNKTVLLVVLIDILKMLHPLMPYVTEEIFTMISDEESIMISKYPEYNKGYIYKEEATLELIKELITKVRKAKQENNVGKDYLFVYDENELLDNNKQLIFKMLKIDNNAIKREDYNQNLTTIDIPFSDTFVSIAFDNSANLQDIKVELEKNIESLEISIERREKLLSNANYVAKAPSNIVENEKTLLDAEKHELTLMLNRLNDIEA